MPYLLDYHARMVRAQILTLREQDFALAAKVSGLSKWQILIHHLIPNSMGSIIVTVTFLIPSAIFQEAFLSFLASASRCRSQLGNPGQ